MKSSPRSPHLEKARTQQRRPNAAKKKKSKKTQKGSFVLHFSVGGIVRGSKMEQIYSEEKSQGKMVNGIKIAQVVLDHQSPAPSFYRGGGRPREGQ